MVGSAHPTKAACCTSPGWARVSRCGRGTTQLPRHAPPRRSEMKRIVTFGVVGILLAAAPGCGGPDALMKELIANLNTYAEVIEKKESKEKQQAALERVRTTAEKFDK